MNTNIILEQLEIYEKYKQTTIINKCKIINLNSLRHSLFVGGGGGGGYSSSFFFNFVLFFSVFVFKFVNVSKFFERFFFFISESFPEGSKGRNHLKNFIMRSNYLRQKKITSLCLSSLCSYL